LAVREEVVKLALPEASSGTVTSVVVPSVKVMLPVGVVVAETVALKVTDWP
jgi:hypothetical protein